MYKILLNYFNISSYKKKLIIGACFGVTLFLSPYLTILEKVQTSRLPNKNMRYGEAMKYMHKNYPQVKQYKAIVNAVAHPQIVFYKRRYNKEGYKITSEQLNNIKTGDTVLICHDPLLRKLNQRYRTKTALNPEKCKLLKVKSKR